MINIGVILEKEKTVRNACGIDFLNKKAFVDVSGSIESHKFKELVKRVDIADLCEDIIWANFTIVEFDYLEELHKPIKLRGVFGWDDIEGRWTIEFDDSYNPYCVLNFNSSLMTNFEIIGDKVNKSKLLKKPN